MQLIPDWPLLWRELVEINTAWKQSENNQGDHWQKKAHHFAGNVSERWKTPDSSRQFILSQVNQSASFLDIGAGTGAWESLLSPHVQRVTALERSPAMLQVLRSGIQDQGLNNVNIIEGTWPDIDVPPHDFSLCSHGMYGCLDLPHFIQHMVSNTRKTCFLLMRVPIANNIMAQAAQKILGQPHDSPNFVIAYNILLQMGIHANVLMEEGGVWQPWAHTSIEEALSALKKRLGIANQTKFDGELAELLQQNLSLQNGQYIWPPSVRSALVYWNT